MNDSTAPKYNFQTLFTRLILDVYDEPISEHSLTLWLVLIHTHDVVLTGPLVYGTSQRRIMALTLRSTADTGAALWRAGHPNAWRDDPERVDPDYWYWVLFTMERPGDLSRLSPVDAARLEELRALLATHPDVEQVVHWTSP